MQQRAPHGFSKQERMNSEKLIEELFCGDHRSMAAFPLRAVYATTSKVASGVPVQVLVSVSKRHFKCAVKRNRVKRQIREAYRQNKHLLADAMQNAPDSTLALAFIWQSDSIYSSPKVTESVTILLRRLAEKL